MLIGVESISNDISTIAIFGCTEYSKRITKIVELVCKDVNIVYFDNYYCKERFDNYEVFRPHYDDCIDCYVICSVKNAETMILQLVELGIDESNICLPADIIQEKYNKILKKRIAQNHKLDYLVIDLVEHCNLNCQSCDHFSPLAKPNYLSISEYKKDAARLSKLLAEGDVVLGELCLEGGEPLLHPEIESFLAISRRFFNNTVINVYSNGVLLLKKEDHFWEILRDFDIGLEITKYPIDFDYVGLEKKCKEKLVKMHYFGGDDVKKTSMHKPIDVSGSQDKYSCFTECYMGNGMCTVLKKGRVYPCTFAPNVSIFNDFFNQKIHVDKRDSIDIYEIETAEEILDFLANPIPACRYCKVKEWTNGHKWAVSKKKIEEWT